MKIPYDFGISQEDPRTEQAILDLQSGDNLLCIASGGEVPLSLLTMNDNLKITAVDTSLPQIMLSRLKLISALNVSFPLNAQFLGYSELRGSERLQIFNNYIRPKLNGLEADFWQMNRKHIISGVVNAGRFEQYIKKMRIAAGLILGKNNLRRLINSSTQDEQNQVFNERIASRYILRVLFKIAFHPKIYRNRGLREQALMHAREDTGQRFFNRFSDFCTGTPASENYFLQYFLTGKCITEKSYPDYIQPRNRERLLANSNNLEFKNISFQNALEEKGNIFYNKIHFSNLGDWMNSDELIKTIEIIISSCRPGTRICYRYLQKDHFANGDSDGIIIERSYNSSGIDRFPFYTSYLITVQ